MRKLMREASVNSVITSPNSAIRRKVLRSIASSLSAGGSSMMRAPATVNRIGAVKTVRSSRRETRL
jgi:hypothetical protein